MMHNILRTPSIQAVLKDPTLSRIMDMSKDPPSRSSEESRHENHRIDDTQQGHMLRYMLNSKELRDLLCDGKTIQQLAKVTLQLE